MNGNKPAFPAETAWPNSECPMGLTKREWLAGMALQAKLTYAGHIDADDIHDCVKYADKLLAELDKKEWT